MFEPYAIVFFIYCRFQRNDHTWFQFRFIIECYPGTFMISSSHAMTAVMRIIANMVAHQVVYLAGPYAWFHCLNADFQRLFHLDKYFLLSCCSNTYNHSITGIAPVPLQAGLEIRQHQVA